ncbi:TIGR03915 family putative DNA repair protein [Gillisia sp. JM1]|uniref:TIGR03915 family putative DNA repair protein n=1 Tax=Gillisia sp. JM1 TaxID=1283286 RepID=UPI000405347E|nr:TIGR03915 family putative DNA repair protein [Gillisia sp. JM1]
MMNGPTTLYYDGSFEGFLTCVFMVFEQGLEVHGIFPSTTLQGNIFGDLETIITDNEKADRVVLGLKNKISEKSYRHLYFAFLSEIEGIELILLQYIQLVFKDKCFEERDFGNPVVLKVSKTAKMVSREKHRMEAFVRFKLTKDEIYFATIEPDFNVLPIILQHFERRYADQKWIIYDIKRNFGLFYNLRDTSYINFNFKSKDHLDSSNTSVFSTSEIGFQKLWQEYFESTNIKARKNMKLHLQHVPKRYWKYLTEKSTWQN